MFLRKGMFAVLAIILVAGTFAFAQERQQPTASPEGTLQRDRTERKERRRERLGRREGRLGRKALGRRAGMGRFMHELNLSEQQREQSRAIVQRRLESTKSQREELFRMREKRIAGTFSAEDEARVKALRQEIRSSMDGIRGEMDSVLTAEQKAKLEELQKEREGKMEQRMQERQQRRQQRQQRLQERSNNRPVQF